MALDVTEINRELDLIYAPSGSIGYVALLIGDVQSDVTITGIDTSTEVITVALSIDFITGSRIRLATTNTLPSVSGTALSTSIDYYVYKITSTTFKLCRTLNDAISGSNFIDFLDSGSGTITVNEQLLNYTDPVSVLVNKEVSHPDYSRHELNGIGGASGGAKIVSWFQYVNGANPSFAFRHALVLLGGSASSTIGDTNGYKNHVLSYSSDQIINPGSSGAISLNITLING